MLDIFFLKDNFVKKKNLPKKNPLINVQPITYLFNFNKIDMFFLYSNMRFTISLSFRRRN